MNNVDYFDKCKYKYKEIQNYTINICINQINNLKINIPLTYI